jgi:hypothetical protein
MTYLIRAAAFFALSLATIPAVANAASAANTSPASIQQDWSNG